MLERYAHKDINDKITSNLFSLQHQLMYYVFGLLSRDFL